jgi:hypothetical protein
LTQPNQGQEPTGRRRHEADGHEHAIKKTCGPAPAAVAARAVGPVTRPDSLWAPIPPRSLSDPTRALPLTQPG